MQGLVSVWKTRITIFGLAGLLVSTLFGCSPSTENRKAVQPAGSGPSNTGRSSLGQSNLSQSQKLEEIPGIKLYPVDEAVYNQDFLQFREEMLTALEAKDLQYLKNHIDSKIKYSFGINNGIQGFVKEWKLDQAPEASRLWTELRLVLELGGTFQENLGFVAPYVFTNFPPTVDAFVYSAVISEDVKLYSKANLKSQVLGVLNYNIVEVVTSHNNFGNQSEVDKQEKLDGWRQVSVGGKQGYVEARFVRSPVSYRASFIKVQGTWKLNFFVAGD